MMLLSAACTAAEEPDSTVKVAHVSARPSGAIGATLSVVDTDGNPVEIVEKGGSSGGDESKVTVETRTGDGEWVVATNVSLGNGPPLLDVMIVADNSGSARDELTDVKDALHHFAGIVLGRAHPDRMGIVRVSTIAEVVADPSADEAPIAAAIDDMFVSNGWTALWDGVRLGRDTLAISQTDPTPNGQCYPARVPSVVVYTDGAENNSADEHDTSYAGDGIDTTFDDLTQLQIDGTRVSIYTVAISDDADSDSLEALAEATGGRHVDIQNHGQLVGALHSAAAQLDGLTPFCFTPAACSDTEARITVKQGNTVHTRTVTIASTCE
jgi:Mg-chelatase subunit ChlD